MRKKQGQHFADIFEVLEKDPDGKRFDKVSRIRAHSDMYEMDLLLDINSDLYPVEVADKFSLALSTTLNRNNEDFPDYYDKDLATKHGKGSLLDDYDYVMHGKVFKFKDNHNTGQLKVEVYVSYGGLLMQITGSPKELESLEVDSNVFLLMRRV